MIPQRCYDDLWFLLDDLRVRRAHAHDKTVVDECCKTIARLEVIIRNWRIIDDKEIDDMYEEFEKSEKDCIWDRD